MNEYVTDTIGLTRYMSGSRKLGRKAKKIFTQADNGGCIIMCASSSGYNGNP